MCILVCFTLPVPPAMLCRLQEHGIWEENPIHVEDHGLLYDMFLQPGGTLLRKLC